MARYAEIYYSQLPIQLPILRGYPEGWEPCSKLEQRARWGQGMVWTPWCPHREFKENAGTSNMEVERSRHHSERLGMQHIEKTSTTPKLSQEQGQGGGDDTRGLLRGEFWGEIVLVAKIFFNTR